MPVFRPSAQVRLTVRLDERASTSTLDARLEGGTEIIGDFPPLPATSEGIDAELVTVNNQIGSLLNQSGDIPGDQFDARLERLRGRRIELQRAGDDPQKQPDATKRPPDQDTLVLTTLPISCQIRRTGIRDADEWEMELDYRDLPLDPRAVRALGVEITIGTVIADEYETGMLGTKRDDGTPTSVVARQAGDFVLGSTTRLVGFASEWDVGYSSKNGDTVRLSGLDVGALPRNEPLPQGLNINLDLPIDEGVSALLNEFVSMKGLQVIYDGEGDPPIPSELMPRARKARKGKSARKVRSGNQEMSVWDHVTDVTVSLGFVPIFDGFELHISEPRTFFANSDNKRTMVYGQNLDNLELARKLSGLKVPTIEVRCYDPQIGRTRWARAPVVAGKPSSGIYTPTDKPPRAGRANEVSPAGTAQDSIKVLAVKGVTNNAFLERIAQNSFDQIGRQEIEGNFSTIEITSWRSEEEGDLLNMRAGEPMEILVDAPPSDSDQLPGNALAAAGGAIAGPVAQAAAESSTNAPTTTSFQELTAMSIARRAEYLAGIGWNPVVAQRMSQAMDAVSFNSTFRVQDVVINWSSDTGLKIDCGFYNFIVVRERPDEQDLNEPLSPGVEAAVTDALAAVGAL